MPDKKPKPLPKPNHTPKPSHIPEYNPTSCIHCINQKDFFQDKICSDFTVSAGKRPTVIYFTNFNQDGDFIASGYIKNGSNTATLTIEFVAGTSASPAADGTVLRKVKITQESCILFTMKNFDTIRAFADPTEGAVNHGEICITPRYHV